MFLPSESILNEVTEISSNTVKKVSVLPITVLKKYRVAVAGTFVAKLIYSIGECLKKFINIFFWVSIDYSHSY